MKASWSFDIFISISVNECFKKQHKLDRREENLLNVELLGFITETSFSQFSNYASTHSQFIVKYTIPRI